MNLTVHQVTRFFNSARSGSDHNATKSRWQGKDCRLGRSLAGRCDRRNLQRTLQAVDHEQAASERIIVSAILAQ
jgi:hypothetical protein